MRSGLETDLANERLKVVVLEELGEDSSTEFGRIED